MPFGKGGDSITGSLAVPGGGDFFSIFCGVDIAKVFSPSDMVSFFDVAMLTLAFGNCDVSHTSALPGRGDVFPLSATFSDKVLSSFLGKSTALFLSTSKELYRVASLFSIFFSSTIASLFPFASVFAVLSSGPSYSPSIRLLTYGSVV